MKKLTNGSRGICFSCERSRILFSFRFFGNYSGTYWNGRAGMCRKCIALALEKGEGHITH